MNLSLEDTTEFRETFQEIIKDLQDVTYVKEIPGAFEWLEELLTTALDGKLIRSKMFIAACFHLMPDTTPLQRKRVFLVGWLLEIIQSASLIIDDIMDQATHRRGRLCWHLNPHVGLSAANDICAIEKCVYIILKKYFREEKYYPEMFELFYENIFAATIGQNLDHRMGSKIFSTCTCQIYEKLVEAKTGTYGFYLPVALALTMARETDPEVVKPTMEVMLQIGVLFQIQDDFLDAFGETIGKDGVDIANGKLTWLIVNALDLATPEQKKEIEAIYGEKDEKLVARVKEIYRDLNLPKVFEKLIDERYENINTNIQKIASVKVKNVLKIILKAIITRKI